MDIIIESYDEFINESSSPTITRMKFIDDFITFYKTISFYKKKFSTLSDNLGGISKNWKEVAELIESGDYDFNDLKKYLDEDDIRDGVRMIYQFNQDLFTKSLSKPGKWNDSVFTDETNYKTFNSFHRKPMKRGFF